MLINEMSKEMLTT